jgi:hypothetical protein
LKVSTLPTFELKSPINTNPRVIATAVRETLHYLQAPY